MAKKEDEEDDPKKVKSMDWNPSMPLADEEDEEETQRRAKAEARKAFLLGQLTKEPEKKPKTEKKRSGLWG